MSAESREETRPDRPNVVTMPPRHQPEPEKERKPLPGPDHAESHDEPGYGHGV